MLKFMFDQISGKEIGFLSVAGLWSSFESTILMLKYFNFHCIVFLT